MAQSDFLEYILPTKWSRWSAATTMLLAPLAYNLPTILPASWQAESEVSSFLIRCILALLTFLIGTLVVLSLVIGYSRKIPALQSENHRLEKLTAGLQDDVASLTNSVQAANGRLLNDGVPMERFYYVPAKRS